MSHHKIINKPTRLADLSFDELYADISYDWRAKAARLQTRRWRLLSEQEEQTILTGPRKPIKKHVSWLEI